MSEFDVFLSQKHQKNRKNDDFFESSFTFDTFKLFFPKKIFARLQIGP